MVQSDNTTEPEVTEAEQIRKFEGASLRIAHSRRKGMAACCYSVPRMVALAAPPIREAEKGAEGRAREERE